MLWTWLSLKPSSLKEQREGTRQGSEEAITKIPTQRCAPESTAAITSAGPRLSGNGKYMGSPGFHYNEKYADSCQTVNFYA